MRRSRGRTDGRHDGGRRTGPGTREDQRTCRQNPAFFHFSAKSSTRPSQRNSTGRTAEKGWVATLLLGDETGTTRVVLWDEKAGAALDTAVGDVLEVIGRHPGKSTHEIYALALRKAGCEITCAVPGGRGTSQTSRLIWMLSCFRWSRSRTFTKRDGTHRGDGRGSHRG